MSWYCPMCEEALSNSDVNGAGRCKDCGAQVETYNDNEDDD